MNKQQAKCKLKDILAQLTKVVPPNAMPHLGELERLFGEFGREYSSLTEQLGDARSQAEGMKRELVQLRQVSRDQAVALESAEARLRQSKQREDQEKTLQELVKGLIDLNWTINGVHLVADPIKALNQIGEQALALVHKAGHNPTTAKIPITTEEFLGSKYLFNHRATHNPAWQVHNGLKCLICFQKRADAEAYRLREENLKANFVTVEISFKDWLILMGRCAREGGIKHILFPQLTAEDSLRRDVITDIESFLSKLMDISGNSHLASLSPAK